MQKLHTPAAKRQATEMGQTIDQEAQTIQVPRPTPVTYAVATGGTPVTPTAAPSPTIRSESTDMETLQTKTDEHSATLAELRKCCASLAASQQQLSNNMSAMNSDINTKFSELVNANLKINDRFLEMSAAIESLRTSSPNRPTKFYKENHTLSESTYFG
jgi:predicted RNase H-like nuclease (RuvC/YqgF family)